MVNRALHLNTIVFQYTIVLGYCQERIEDTKRPTEKGQRQMNTDGRDTRPVAYYIFRTKMTVHGVTLYAKDYGLKAFRIPIYR